MDRKQSFCSQKSHLCQDACLCTLCLKTVRRQNEIIDQKGNSNNLIIPNQIAYRFICDLVVLSSLRSKFVLHIMDTFFFEGKKASHYKNDTEGKIIKVSGKSFKQIQRILIDKKHQPILVPSKKTQIKQESGKQVVSRKLKNNIGLMILNDGSFKYLNQINLSYEIQNTANICFIKSYHNCRLKPVYYKHQQLFSTDIYKRAKTYIRVLLKQITPFQINFIKQEEQIQYEHELRLKNIQTYLTYLTCKLCYLALIQKFFLFSSGVFVWVLDDATTGIYLGNCHDLSYTLQKDPNQLLERFMSKKRRKVQKRLQSIANVTLKTSPSKRMKSFENILECGYKMALNESAPKVEFRAQSKMQSDQIFKKLHPKLKYNLSDIIGNNQKFNQQMTKIFKKKLFKHKCLNVSKVIPNQIKVKAQQQKIQSSNLNNSLQKTIRKRAVTKSINSSRCFQQLTTSKKPRSYLNQSCRVLKFSS